MSLPRISIVTPSLNQADWLERALCSILAQKYPNLEYVVIDGGSTDGSLELIQRYAGSLNRWELQQGQGFARGLNQGFSKTTGEIMGWLNADDVYLPHALEIVGQIFGDYPQIEWLPSHTVNITADDQLFALQPARKTFAWWAQVAHCSPPTQHCTFWRRSLWDRAGGSLAEGNRFADCELWLRFYEYAKPYIVDTILAGWRIHAGSYSAQRLRQLHEAIDAAQKSAVEKSLQGHPIRKLLWPVAQAYLRNIDRGLTSRLLFELQGRKRRFLTYSLKTNRFILGGAGGMIPQAWPLTIEIPENSTPSAVSVHGAS